MALDLVRGLARNASSADGGAANVEADAEAGAEAEARADARRRAARRSASVNNRHVYRAALSVCEQHGRGQFALGLLNSALETDVGIDVVEMTYALRACEKSGDWAAAYEVMSRMREVTEGEGGDVARKGEGGGEKGQAAGSVGPNPTWQRGERGERGGVALGGVSRLRALQLLARSEPASGSASEGGGIGKRAAGRGVTTVTDDVGSGAGVEVGAASGRGTGSKFTSQFSAIGATRLEWEAERGRTLNVAVVTCATGGQWEAATALLQRMEASGEGHIIDAVVRPTPPPTRPSSGTYHQHYHRLPSTLYQPSPSTHHTPTQGVFGYPHRSLEGWPGQ